MVSNDQSADEQIEAIIAKLGDWRGQRLAHLRALIKLADPEVTEEVKWKKPSNPDGIPVWSHTGMICTGEFYKNHLRLTFSKGKSLPDPQGLLNSYRSMVIQQDDKINEEAFKALIRSAVELNTKKV